MLVLDASMALSWLFERETVAERKRAVGALDRLEKDTAVVPALWHTEVLNALLVGERRKLVMPAQSTEYLARLGMLPISVDSAAPMVRRDAVVGLGRQHDLTAYDATYLDLAMRTGGPLASFDRQLAKAAVAVGIEVV
ncbi:MAG: type II toxin-antitoxin system VapC family toxin [Casimicrobiaceae bacterium]